MKKKILLLASCLLCLSLFAIPSAKASAADEYDITSYDVAIDVTEGNLLHITEKIGVNFNKKKHGIYRNIPMRNKIEREDGSTDTIHAKISNVSCGDDEFSESSDSGNEVLQIGDEDVTMTGPKDYTISYDYDLGNDPLKDIDEFYYNIIGTGWDDTTISNVTFTITMPKEFDEAKLGFSYGKAGSSTHEEVLYTIDDKKVIRGQLEDGIVLKHNEGVTIRVELPEGYFLKSSTFDMGIVIAIVISLLGIGIATLFWFLFGRDDPVVETVEFYPPEGKNSVDVAFLYKGNASNEDIVSLLVYLANKGYLRIEEYGEKKKRYRFVKLKDYDGDNLQEQRFMSGLFSVGDTATENTLRNSFYTTINSVSAGVNNKENRNKIYFANSLNKNWILYVLMVIVILLITYVPVFDYDYDTFEALFATGGMAFGLFTFFSSIFGEGKLSRKIPGGILGAGVTAVFFLWIVMPALVDQAKYILPFTLGVISIATMIFFSKYMSKRTPYGNEMLGRIGGFKNFLETAEKDKLEMMVEENPTYFYDILPYTYVLGVSDKWMKKFEGLALDPPDWYQGSDMTMFNMMYFNHFMNNTMHQATSSMTSQPSQSSGSSGGGFSGGGSGGGGGGSW